MERTDMSHACTKDGNTVYSVISHFGDIDSIADRLGYLITGDCSVSNCTAVPERNSLDNAMDKLSA